MQKHEARALRTALGWTQVQLAHALGVTSNTVARWENGVHAVPGPVATSLLLLVQKRGASHSTRRPAIQTSR